MEALESDGFTIVPEVLETRAVAALISTVSGAKDGAGSHRDGRLTAPEIQRQRAQVMSVACPVPSGRALLMRPRLLHASSVSRSPRHRRVIHVEYAAGPLPGGLRWRREDKGMTK